MKKVLFFTAKMSLVCVLLVVLAGSVVRMTGSGMGCPDWPKCFGYLIPPTERAVLEWAPGRVFESGQMIIRDEALWVAQSDFTSGQNYDASRWEKYTRHDYALFNALHTWTEYINRLIGAFSGIPVFLTFVLSLAWLRRAPSIPLMAFGVLILLGSEAWLGKVVVDGNLVPGQITIHMFGALAIVALLLALLGRLRRITGDMALRADARFRLMLSIAILLSLIQILLGTQVREEIDVIAKAFGGAGRDTWVAGLPMIFKVHRSFSILVLVVNAALVVFNWLRWEPIKEIYWLGGLVLLEIITGITLAYAGLPKAFQPVHLVFSFLMFALQAYVWFRTAGSTQSSPSSE